MDLNTNNIILYLISESRKSRKKKKKKQNGDSVDSSERKYIQKIVKSVTIRMLRRRI